MKQKIIIRNRARCKKCNTIAESTNRHHLCFCECGAIFVDGGRDYLRRGGDLENYEDLSEFSDTNPIPKSQSIKQF